MIEFFLLFIFRRYLEILRNTSFGGVSGHISFRNGTSRRALVEIQQFVYNDETRKASYKVVGTYDPDAVDGM